MIQYSGAEIYSFFRVLEKEALRLYNFENGISQDKYGLNIAYIYQKPLALKGEVATSFFVKR
jgi:hypothetical protein